VVDKDATHLSRSNVEEVRPVLPGNIHGDEFDESLVHDGGGLQGVTRPFAFNVSAGARPAIHKYERCKTLQRSRVAGLPGG
jgi:hypothetical protein